VASCDFMDIPPTSRECYQDADLRMRRGDGGGYVGSVQSPILHLWTDLPRFRRRNHLSVSLGARLSRTGYFRLFRRVLVHLPADGCANLRMEEERPRMGLREERYADLYQCRRNAGSLSGTERLESRIGAARLNPARRRADHDVPAGTGHSLDLGGA